VLVVISLAPEHEQLLTHRATATILLLVLLYGGRVYQASGGVEGPPIRPGFLGVLLSYGITPLLYGSKKIFWSGQTAWSVVNLHT